MQKWLIASTIFLGISFAPALVQGQKHDTTQAFELEVQGAKGTWFPSDMTRKMLAKIEQLKALDVTIAEQDALITTRDEQLVVKDQRIVQVKEALQLSIQAEARMAAVVLAAVRGQRQAEDDLDAWYRSPGLWAGIGVLGVVILEVGVLVLYKSLEAK